MVADPDLDAIYMDAVQAMTGQGGWPMSVFLNHDRQPFFADAFGLRLVVRPVLPMVMPTGSPG